MEHLHLSREIVGNVFGRLIEDASGSKTLAYSIYRGGKWP
jgi:hypothetical protein